VQDTSCHDLYHFLYYDAVALSSFVFHAFSFRIYTFFAIAVISIRMIDIIKQFFFFFFFFFFASFFFYLYVMFYVIFPSDTFYY
jgi:hypothetical protein